MTSHNLPDPRSYIATLVFGVRDTEYRRETHVLHAANAEVAYRQAMLRGLEPRHERCFLGLAELSRGAATHGAPDGVHRGDGQEQARSKHELHAFREPDSSAPSLPEEAIAEALGEPLPLVHLQGLDDEPWERLEYAYGFALAVPIDLRRAASTDSEMARQAVWELGGSIYHQGSLYEATASAIPFLVALAREPAVSVRREVVDLLCAISKCDRTPDEKVWTASRRLDAELPEHFERGAAEHAEARIREHTRSARALGEVRPDLEHLSQDPDAHVASVTTAILSALDSEADAVECPRCGGLVPRFTDLDAGEEARLRHLAEHGEAVRAIRELREATGCSWAVAMVWFHHPHGPKPLPRGAPPMGELSMTACPGCGAALRRGATSCFAAGCGYELPPGRFASGLES